MPDYDFEEFEVGSAGQDRRGEDPDRDTPRSRGRFTDDGDDRIFRQATDDEQAQRARPDRGSSESGLRHGHLDFISMAMNMARPHSDDPEAMPTRPPRSLVPGESQVSDELGDRPRGPGTMVLAPRDISDPSTGSQNPGQFEERKFTGIGYELTSTAGWGSSVKQESDADRPNPAAAMMTIMPHLRIVVMRKRIWHAEVQGAVLLQGPGVSPVELRGTFLLTGTPGARERGPGIAGKFFRVWRPFMTGVGR